MRSNTSLWLGIFEDRSKLLEIQTKILNKI